MAYKQYKSPFTRPQDPPPGDEKERGGKIKAWVEKQDANLKSWSKQRKDEGKRFGANVYRDASWLLAGGHFNFGDKRNKEEPVQDAVEPAQDAVEPAQTEDKNRSKSGGNFGLAIRQSNFVKKHRKLNMALTNMFTGTKAGKDTNVSGGEQLTPWQNYRGAVKDVKQEIRENPLFSQDRREARKDFRGMYGATINREGKIVQTSRISEKNRLQQKILKNKRKGNNPNRATHQPFVPYPKEASTQLTARDMSNRQVKMEIASNATKYEGVGVLKAQGHGGRGQGSCPKGNCTKPEDPLSKNPSKK